MTATQRAIFRALDFALAVDGKSISGVEERKPLPRLAGPESGNKRMERMETRLRLQS